MPNIKSAIKRVKVNEKKHLRNRMVKSAMRTTVKKYESAVAAGSADAALLSQTASAIDKAVAKGVISKNAANRKKARMAKRLAKAEARLELHIVKKRLYRREKVVFLCFLCGKRGPFRHEEPLRRVDLPPDPARLWRGRAVMQTAYFSARVCDGRNRVVSSVQGEEAAVQYPRGGMKDAA